MPSRSIGFLAVLLLLSLCRAATPDASSSLQVLYVANGMNRSARSGSISAFTIDPASGSLTPVTGSPFDAGLAPYGFAADDLHHLYLSNPLLDDDNLRVYPIRSNSGRLGYEHVSTFEGINYEGERNCCPGPIAVDRRGRFALVGNSANKTISTFEVDPSMQALTLTSSANTRPGHYPQALVWGFDQSYLFALTDPASAQSLLHIYRVSEKGVLTEAQGSPASLPYAAHVIAPADPHSLIVIQNLPRAPEIASYTIAKDGPLQTAPGSRVSLAPSNNVVAATLSSDSSWLALAISPKSGRGTSLSLYRISASGTVPAATLALSDRYSQITSLVFDVEGRFLFSTEASQNVLLGFEVASDHSKLTPIPSSPWSTGQQPHSAIALKLR